MTKTLGKTIGDSHGIDETIGEKIIDAKIMEPEMRDRSTDRENYLQDFSNNRNRGIDRDRSRRRERHLTPRRDDRRYQSPNSNSGTRDRSTSRVTTNRDRVSYYKCRE